MVTPTKFDIQIYRPGLTASPTVPKYSIGLAMPATVALRGSIKMFYLALRGFILRQSVEWSAGWYDLESLRNDRKVGRSNV